MLSQLASESEIRGVELNLSSYYKIDLSERLQMQVHYAYQPGADLESFNSRTISTFTSLGGSRDSQEINLSNDGLDQTISRLPSKQTFGGGIGEPKNGLLVGNGPHQKSLSIMYSTRQDLFDMNLPQNYHSVVILFQNMILFHLIGNVLFIALVLYHLKLE